MTAAETLDPRKQEILEAIVRAHIATGAAVSSSAVSRRSGQRLSAATIRNEMASLEEAGYLHQPHTSAGRIPTAKAYEFYAQEVALKARLRPSDEQWLRGQFPVEQSDAEELLARVPHALAELCHGVGLILLPPLARTVLEQVRFVPLDAHRVLAVVLTRTGLVRDKAVRTRQPFRPEELERMAAYLNEHFRGWTLEAIRREMEHRVAADRSEFLHQALNLCRESFDPEPPAEALHLEGVAHLLEPGREARPEELRRLLEALEEKERLARLLRDCVEAPEQPVRILIGLERLAPALKEFTLIGAPYGRSEASAGSLGLLGRTRMDYARAITAVSYLADLFDRALAEN